MPTIIGCTLSDPYYSTVESVREELVETFGVDEYANPFPHFTLFPLADDVDVPAVVSAVEEAVADQSPFSVHTDGVGVFPQNAVWLPVAKSPELTAFHQDVVDAVDAFGPPPVPYYKPGRWFPHVGFALADDTEQAASIVEYLLDHDFEWDVPIDTVTITRPPAGGGKYEKQATIEL